MKLISFVLVFFLVSCQEYIPYKELDGKVLCDSTGNCYKLEWQNGWGETWRFRVPVKKIGTDTITNWQYMGKP